MHTLNCMGREVSEAWLSFAVLRTTLLCPILGEISLSMPSNVIDYENRKDDRLIYIDV